MPEFNSHWPLWEFECDPETLFQILDKEDRGIALLRTPGINPQGLVDRFAALVINRGILDKSFSSRPAVSYRNSDDLVHATPISCRALDTEADEFYQEYSNTFQVIGRIASDVLLANTDKRQAIDVSTRRLKLYAHKYEQKIHTDSNLVTAYLGSTASGHIMKLPDGSELPITRLPAGYVLLTRQREWAKVFSLAEGIEHSANFHPTAYEPFRAIGLNFIG